MLIGRNIELSSLEDSYQAENNSLVVLYGRTGIGKTTLLNEFMSHKKCVYYHAAIASEKQQLELLNLHLKQQFTYSSTVQYQEAEDYRSVFEQMQAIDSDVKLIVIEEFQNIIKNNHEFMEAIAQLIKGNLFHEQVMVVLTSSSISWVENNMVANVGANASAITSFIKLKELSFVNTVRMFPDYSVLDSMILYAITGGVPKYLTQFEDQLSIKENICKHILRKGCMLSTEGNDYVKEELRETALYNTILYCIAGKENKLNELHLHTGFGRDKISVYLKNLMEREIVEKIYSFDADGSIHTRKGLYRIKAGLIEFWFRYIYPNKSWLEILSEEEFYDRFIATTLEDFVIETFVKVGTEYIELLNTMNQLPIKISHRGRWWGKNGNLDIIARDEEYHYIVGKCNWLSPVFTFEMFEEFMYNINLAGIGKDYLYLFSRETFDQELMDFAEENKNVKLISLHDL